MLGNYCLHLSDAELLTNNSSSTSTSDVSLRPGIFHVWMPCNHVVGSRVAGLNIVQCFTVLFGISRSVA